jgi:hypothetical protein
VGRVAVVSRRRAARACAAPGCARRAEPHHAHCREHTLLLLALAFGPGAAA